MKMEIKFLDKPGRYYRRSISHKGTCIAKDNSPESYEPSRCDFREPADDATTNIIIPAHLNLFSPFLQTPLRLGCPAFNTPPNLRSQANASSPHSNNIPFPVIIYVQMRFCAPTLVRLPLTPRADNDKSQTTSTTTTQPTQ